MSMGMWVNEGTPTMRFVLYTINVDECAMQVMQHESIHNTEDNLLFSQKIQNFAKNKYLN